MKNYVNKLKTLPKKPAPIKIKTNKVNMVIGDFYCNVPSYNCPMSGLGCISDCPYNQKNVLVKRRKMKTNQKGLNLIKSFEGLKLKAYLCPAGIPTIGYGTIAYPDGTKVKLGDVCTEQQATEYLINHIEKIEKQIDTLKVELNENQYSAIVSFVYNLGIGNFKSSTLYKKILINPNDPTIRVEFGKWVKGGGKVLPGLVKRREVEKTLYYLPIVE